MRISDWSSDVCSSDLIDVASVLPEGIDAALYDLRSVVTRRLKPVPVEAIARGYLIGSGWRDYQKTGRVSGITLPDGLRQAQRSEERRVGKQCVRTCRSRWSPYQ